MSEKAKKSAKKEPQEQVAPETALEAEAVGHTEAEYKVVIEDLNDKLLRAMAEAQNTRRRAEIDIQNAKNFSLQSFAKDLLGVMDNLFRACETISDAEAEQEPKLKAMKEGIEITRKEMVNVLERSGIRRIEPSGELFDPNLHQAISQIPDGSVAAGTVMQVLQAGYVLKDRLLRPALVVVAKAE